MPQPQLIPVQSLEEPVYPRVGPVAGTLAAVVLLSVMLFFEDRARGLNWRDRVAWTGPTGP